MPADMNSDNLSSMKRDLKMPLPATGGFSRTTFAVLALAVSLSGCAGVPDSALVDPAKFDYYACVDLARVMKANQIRAHELRVLDAKAARDEVGVFVGAVTYTPEYKSLRGEMKLIEEVARRKDCAPPIVMAREFAADLQMPQ
jgi:hypothetical protein